MPKFVLFVLLSVCALGFGLLAWSLKGHLHGGGLPSVAEIWQNRTPRGRLLFKGFVAGMVLAAGSLASVLALGPWKF
jgi:hypothetical protein